MKLLKNKVLYFLSPLVIIAVCITMMAMVKPEQGHVAQMSEVERHTGLSLSNAIFSREGVIYFFNGNNGVISQLTSERFLRYDPSVSPGYNRILYRNPTFDYNRNPQHLLSVGLIDLIGNEILTLNIESDFSSEIIGHEWINNDTFAIRGHVNPSTQEYFVFDANTGEEIKRLAGYAFSPTPDGMNIMYAENIPHGFSDRAFHSYIMNENVIYTSDIMGATLSRISFDKNSGSFAFIMTLPSIEDTLKTTQKLITGILEDEKMIVMNEIEIPDNVYGYLSFDAIGNVSFVTQDTKFTLMSDNSFNAESDIASIRNTDHNTTLYERYIHGIYESFGDLTLDKIFSLTWIP